MENPENPFHIMWIDYYEFYFENQSSNNIPKLRDSPSSTGSTKSSAGTSNAPAKQITKRKKARQKTRIKLLRKAEILRVGNNCYIQLTWRPEYSVTVLNISILVWSTKEQWETIDKSDYSLDKRDTYWILKPKASFAKGIRKPEVKIVWNFGIEFGGVMHKCYAKTSEFHIIRNRSCDRPVIGKCPQPENLKIKLGEHKSHPLYRPPSPDQVPPAPSILPIALACSPTNPNEIPALISQSYTRSIFVNAWDNEISNQNTVTTSPENSGENSSLDNLIYESSMSLLIEHPSPTQETESALDPFTMSDTSGIIINEWDKKNEIVKSLEYSRESSSLDHHLIDEFFRSPDEVNIFVEDPSPIQEQYVLGSK